MLSDVYANYRVVELEDSEDFGEDDHVPEEIEGFISAHEVRLRDQDFSKGTLGTTTPINDRCRESLS